jgi:uncharacterized membrane protein YdjX (TVP38/TMEM64 family)
MWHRLAPATVFVLAAAVTAASYLGGGVARVLLDTALWDADALSTVHLWVQGLGALAPAGYVLAVILEVVIAPIPSPILYAAGGTAFGGFGAGVLTLAGNAVGALVSAWLGKSLGEAWVRRRLGGRHDGWRARLYRRGFWMVFLLRLNPMTSSDVVSYAAGALGLGPGRVSLATTLGIAPLVFAQTHAGPQLLEAFPAAGAVLLAGGVIYMVVVVIALFR